MPVLVEMHLARGALASTQNGVGAPEESQTRVLCFGV